MIIAFLKTNMPCRTEPAGHVSTGKSTHRLYQKIFHKVKIEKDYFFIILPFVEVVFNLC